MLKFLFILVSFLWGSMALASADKAANILPEAQVRSVIEQAMLQSVQEAFDAQQPVELANLSITPAAEDLKPNNRPEEAEKLSSSQGAFFTSGYGIFKKWYVGGEMLIPVDVSSYRMVWPGLAPGARWQGDIDIERQLGLSGFVGRNLFIGLRLEGEFILNNQKGPGFSDLDFVSPNSDEERLLGQFVKASAAVRSIRKSQMFLNLYYDFKQLRKEGNWTPYVGLGVGRDSVTLKDVTNRWQIAALSEGVAPVVRRAFVEGAAQAGNAAAEVVGFTPPNRDSVTTDSPKKRSVNYQFLVGVDYRIPALQRLSVGAKGRFQQARDNVANLGAISLMRRPGSWQIGVNMKVLLGPMD